MMMMTMTSQNLGTKNKIYHIIFIILKSVKRFTIYDFETAAELCEFRSGRQLPAGLAQG